MHPDRLWAITAIKPDRKGIETRSFASGQREAAREWIEKWNGKRNIYWHVNEPAGPIGKKAEKEDIGAAHFLHVDVDPRAGEELAEEQERLRRLIVDEEGWPKNLPRPQVVVFSGGGYQAFWRLSEPVPIKGDVAAAEEFERYNKAVELLLGADNCHNVDRIMRLPGTLNIPDEKKIKKGRVPVEAMVDRAVDGSVPLSMFHPAPAVNPNPDTPTLGRVHVPADVPRLADVNELDVDDAVKIVIVQGELPPEDCSEKQQGFTRSHWLMYATCALIRGGVADEVVFSIITDPQFGISAHVLAQKGDTRKYAIRQIERAHEFVVSPYLRDMNEKHAVIGNLGGKCRVIEEVYDESARRQQLTKQSFADCCNRYMNVLVEAGTKQDGTPVYKPLGKWWLEHPLRRQYDRLAFSPGKNLGPDVYNLWRGFAVEPAAGDCTLFLEHCRDVICGGDEDYYRYLLGWLARAVQSPDRPGETAVVLRGRQGTGKTLFAELFGELFGRHYLAVTDAKHLTGSFNAHLRDCVVLFGDEAFNVGDRGHEQKLKTLVTSSLLTYEAKGVDSEAGPNYVHLIAASNAEWVVPADLDDRRFFVLDVSAHRAGDRQYFAALVRETRREGGAAALLKFLLEYDLSGFEVRDVPKTGALRDQQRFSAEPHVEAFMRCLETGVTADGPEWKGPGEADYISTAGLLKAMGRADAGKGAQTRIGMFLGKLARKDRAGRKATRNRVIDDERRYLIRLRPLEDLREEFDRYRDEPWPDDGGVWRCDKEESDAVPGF